MLLVLALGASPAAWADKAHFSGGCFWRMQSDFEGLKGVQDVVSDFTGGTAKNPTYNGDRTGHYESIEVTYDPMIVSYWGLLDHYWVNIDPFDAIGQFCDEGPGYLTAIFPGKQVATQILDASTFYPIEGSESGHQDCYKKNPLRYKLYRYTCGRDARLEEIWGDRVTH